MSTHSIFEPLDPAANEIRLLKLLPGKAGDPITCTLYKTSLDQRPKFEAISYVWGDPTNTRAVLVNNVPHDVTVNLEDALRGLRLHNRPRHLWADAVCINQNNIQEKNDQVPKMTDIYSQASRVLVWLGESSTSIREAVAWAKGYHRIGPRLRRTKLKLLSRFSASNKDQYLDELMRMTDGCLGALAHPYWGRMWTYQEYRLPHTPPLLVWRDLQISGEVFRAGVIAASEKRKSARGSAEPRPSLNVGNISEDYRVLAYSRLVLFLQPVAKLDDIFSLFVQSDDRMCSDPRDRVYALYGLAPSLRIAHAPDYNKPVEQVVHKAACYMATTGVLWQFLRSWDLYEQRLCVQSGSIHDQPPSWVPDLAGHSVFVRLAFDMTGRAFRQFHGVSTSASKQTWTPGCLNLSANGRILQIRAREIGDHRLLVRFSPEIDELLLGHVVSDILAKCMSISPTGSQLRGEIRDAACPNLGERLARALRDVASSDVSAQKLLSDVTQMEAAAEAAKNGGNLVVGEDQGFDIVEWAASQGSEDMLIATYLVARLRCKVVFITMGCIGITGGDTRTGDKIVVADGLLHPVVLRKTETVVEGTEEHEYKMVGFAYLDGIMDNEFEDPELVSQILKQEQRTLYIS